MAQMLLHGTLHATIFEADSLGSTPRSTRKAPTMSRRSFTRRLSWLRRVSFRRPKLVGNDIGLGKGLASKLYATIDLEKARVGRTRMVDEPLNPRWYESFHIYCAHMAANVIFTIKSDNHPIGASLIGRAYLPVEEILYAAAAAADQGVDRWLEICDESRNPLTTVSGGLAKLHVQLHFFHVSRDRNWARGISSPRYPGVPYTFFPQRQGCKVSLYQDAHLPDSFMIPKISLASGRYYEPQRHRCWEDIFDAISNARHLVYIAGWSVYTDITLIRDPRRPKPGGDVTLGALLKRKAAEGIRVLVLVWDDRTSVGLLKKDGLMTTHDEETANYFRGTDVKCILCPRDPDNGGSFVQDLQISTMFTHHQKIVVVDGEMPNKSSQQRRIVSFIGGIDLCDGRYDTQFHSLFRTLDTVLHHDDFHQPNFPNASIRKGGPREPWHDAHCRLEGPIAWDVLFNFEQRWRKQGVRDDLLNLTGIIIPPSPVMFMEDKETWNVQLFRSIDGGAASGFPEKPEDAARAGLVSGKDHIIDRSIQDAYINAIRRARNFIYIENQYFLGSSFAWKADDDIKTTDIGALHLIPKELSLKVVSKIEAGEQFRVYVVVPMWPEGVPESASVQAILDWQRRTMEMMYMDIALALRAKGLEAANPRDYLAFFCLGNREAKKTREYIPEEEPEPNSDYSRAQKARRFMIYVHSKMMIVDDEYIIMGSANINQRSMDGARDTEIAMGAYQPYRLASSTGTNGKPARGQIHGFRMALWYEHLGRLDDLFLNPESLECMQKVSMIADKYWDLYTRDSVPDQDLPGHLLSYPISVTDEGQTMATMRGLEQDFFPDTKAPVLGTKSDYLPPILTT